MPEQHDPFDAKLRDRINAAETRVRVSSTAPDDLPPAHDRAAWLRPALVLATAAAAVVLAVFVIGQLPDRSGGNATPPPSAGEGVFASARNGDFVLTLSSPRSAWDDQDEIEVTATLSYDGDEPEVEIGGGGGPVVFSLIQLEGGNGVLGGGQELPCLRYALGPDAPLVWPFQKAGGIDDEPPFDRAFFDDPELHLPPGRWEVRAELQYGDPECGNIQEFAVSISLDVLDANASPGPSAVATEPASAPPSPPASSPSPGPTFDDDPPELTGIFEGDAELEGGCIWLRDPEDRRWEVMWPDGYRATFRDDVPVLLEAGQVLAKAGDTITVRGHRPTGLGSHCMVGTLYEADSVRIP